VGCCGDDVTLISAMTSISAFLACRYRQPALICMRGPFISRGMSAGLLRHNSLLPQAVVIRTRSPNDCFYAAPCKKCPIFSKVGVELE
jgi:hypothetical protein